MLLLPLWSPLWNLRSHLRSLRSDGSRHLPFLCSPSSVRSFLLLSSEYPDFLPSLFLFLSVHRRHFLHALPAAHLQASVLYPVLWSSHWPVLPDPCLQAVPSVLFPSSGKYGKYLPWSAPARYPALNHTILSPFQCLLYQKWLSHGRTDDSRSHKTDLLFQYLPSILHKKSYRHNCVPVFRSLFFR